MIRNFSRVMFHISRSERGVALLLVLSSILLLSAIVVEFAYNANVTFNVAQNEKDRLEANYLALSGLNFAKIVIRYDKDAKQMVQDAARRLGRNLQVQPLYQMIPINSALLRGMMEASGGSEGGGEGAGEAPAPAGGENKFETAQQGISAMNLKEAKSFLDFEGDFSAEVEPQDGKIPLNAFYTLNPTQFEYDRLKTILQYLFWQKSFEPYLKDRVKDSQDLAQKIADFVDKNDAVNESGGNDRGPEVSAYAGTNLKPKSGKLFTADELMLIPGITDDLLAELKKHVTVYKTNDKINACLASDEVLRAMIVAFTYSREDVEDVRPDNEDRLKSAIEKIRAKCPDTSAMSQALNEELGIAAPGGGSATPSPGSPSGSTTQPASGGTTPAPPAAGGRDFASMISADETIYKIEAAGTVGNAEVKIVDVLNTSSPNPDQWKDLYWRVE